MVRLHDITEEDAYALKRDYEEEKALKLLDANKLPDPSGIVGEKAKKGETAAVGSRSGKVTEVPSDVGSIQS